MTDDLDDATLLARFATGELAPSAFRHREHLRVAFAMLRGADFGEAAIRFRRALGAFATAAGAADKFHETLTWAYLALVNRRMHETPSATSTELLAQHPDLLDGSGLARHYDLAAIVASPLARRVFVLPERG